jgi:hypothetical protein
MGKGCHPSEFKFLCFYYEFRGQQIVLSSVWLMITFMQIIQGWKQCYHWDIVIPLSLDEYERSHGICAPPDEDNYVFVLRRDMGKLGLDRKFWRVEPKYLGKYLVRKPKI